MDKKYLAKIITSDNEGLQMISACTAGAKVKISNIKYLASNKVFLLSIERTKIETGQENKKINEFTNNPKIRCKIDENLQKCGFWRSYSKTDVTIKFYARTIHIDLFSSPYD